MNCKNFKKILIFCAAGLLALSWALPTFSQASGDNRLYSGPRVSPPPPPNPSARNLDPFQDNFYQQYSAWMDQRIQNFENFFSGDEFFSDSEDLFKEMIEMRKDMLQRMRNNQAHIQKLPKMRSPKAQPNQSFHEILREEKDGKLFITIQVPDLEKGTVKVEARKHHLLLTRQMTQQTQSGQSTGVFTSQIQKTIPLPPGADPRAVQFHQEEGNIVVEVPLESLAKPPMPQAKVPEQI